MSGIVTTAPDQIHKACGGVCAHCGQELDKNYIIKNAVPLTKFERPTLDNSVVLCQLCAVHLTVESGLRYPKPPAEQYRKLPIKRLAQLQALYEHHYRGYQITSIETLFPSQELAIEITEDEIVKHNIQMHPGTIEIRKVSKDYAELMCKDPKYDEDTAYYKVDFDGNFQYLFTARLLDVKQPAISEYLRQIEHGNNSVSQNEIQTLRDELTRFMPAERRLCIDIFTNPQILHYPKTTDNEITMSIAKIAEIITKIAESRFPGPPIQWLISTSKADIIGAGALTKSYKVFTGIARTRLTDAIERPNDLYTTAFHITKKDQYSTNRQDVIKHMATDLKCCRITVQEALNSLHYYEMTETNTIQAKNLTEKIEKLPPEAIAELNQYVDYLMYKFAKT